MGELFLEFIENRVIYLFTSGMIGVLVWLSISLYNDFIFNSLSYLISFLFIISSKCSNVLLFKTMIPCLD